MIKTIIIATALLAALATSTGATKAPAKGHHLKVAVKAKSCCGMVGCCTSGCCGRSCCAK